MESKHNFQYCCALSVILAIASAAYFLNGCLGEYSGKVSTYCLSVSLIIALLAMFPRGGDKKTSAKNSVKKSLWLIILAIGIPDFLYFNRSDTARRLSLHYNLSSRKHRQFSDDCDNR